MGRDKFIRTLNDQVTVYDKEGNIIDQIPPPPEVPPEVKYVNILELENKLMGNDSEAKPDFFIDVENSELFRDISEDYLELKKCFERSPHRNLLELISFMVLMIGSVICGYLLV